MVKYQERGKRCITAKWWGYYYSCNIHTVLFSLGKLCESPEGPAEGSTDSGQQSCGMTAGLAHAKGRDTAEKAAHIGVPGRGCQIRICLCLPTEAVE